MVGRSRAWRRRSGSRSCCPGPRTRCRAGPGGGVDLDVAGVSPFVTPNDDFYRIDTALTVPRVEHATVGPWRVTGHVDRPLTLTYDELLDRPMVEADITLSCVSNEVGGDLVGNARWLGCRLDDLLDEAGDRPPAPTRSSAARSTGSPQGSRPPCWTVATRWSRSA